MTSAATVEKCDCRAVVLRGDCELGIDSRADVLALSTQGLAIAALTGRRVFDLVRERGVWAIRGRYSLLAALTEGCSDSTLYLAEHACGQPLPNNGRSAVAAIAPPVPDLLDSLGIPYNTPPPF